MALIRAWRGGPVDGVLRSAEAFAALADRPVVEQCFRIDEQPAAGGERVVPRLRASERSVEQWASAQCAR